MPFKKLKMPRHLNRQGHLAKAAGDAATCCRTLFHQRPAEPQPDDIHLVACTRPLAALNVARCFLTFGLHLFPLILGHANFTFEI